MSSRRRSRSPRGTKSGFWRRLAAAGGLAASAGAAAAGIAGWAATRNPLYLGVLGGACSGLAYYLARLTSTPAAADSRAEAVAQVEQDLLEFPLPKRSEERRQWQERAAQLRRILELEQIVDSSLPVTSSGVSALNARQQLEVDGFVDRAIELAGRRVALLRALRANPLHRCSTQLANLLAQRRTASARVAAELDNLIAQKREEVARIKRWEEDLALANIGLDQIETFLGALAYDPAFTPANLGNRIQRLATQVQARRESAEEIERRLGDSAS
jgi:hypothetical protein